MKDHNHFHIRMLVAVSILFSFLTAGLYCFGQEAEEKNESFVSLSYWQSSTSRKITASLSARIQGERGRIKVANGEIEFLNLTDGNPMVLGTSKTNADGIAELEIGNSDVLPNSDGYLIYGAVFKGDEKFAGSQREMSVRNISLELSFAEIDSVRTILASAYYSDMDGEKVPVNEEVSLYVPRQFSFLKVGQIDLEEGQGSIGFPVTIPGDSSGNLQIIARIEESDDFGTVEAAGVKEWGKPRPPVVIEKRRGLGDTDAPLWMVYTLIVLLSTVWFHYMYIAFVLLVQIKRKGIIHSAKE